MLHPANHVGLRVRVRVRVTLGPLIVLAAFFVVTFTVAYMLHYVCPSLLYHQCLYTWARMLYTRSGLLYTLSVRLNLWSELLYTGLGMFYTGSGRPSIGK